MREKLGRALEQPKFVPKYIIDRFSKSVRLLRKGRYGEAAVFIVDGFVDRDVYGDYIKSHHGRIVHRNVLGSEMALDVNDENIGRLLMVAGIREKTPTRIFRSLIQHLDREESIILDIGANIGYYALQEADLLPEAQIHAFEPHPENVELLQRSVDLNGYLNVEIQACAVGEENGEAELAVADQPNLHSIAEDAIEEDNTISVPMTTVDSFLEEKEYENETYVVRIDVEGHESSVFEGMKNTLRSNDEILLFLELHGTLKRKEREEMMNLLTESNFHVVYTGIDQGGKSSESVSFDDIAARGDVIYLIAQKGLDHLESVDIE